LGPVRILSRSELDAARHRPFDVEESSVPGLDEPSRALATSIRPLGRPRVLIVGTTTQDRAETLSSFRDELLIAGPLALVLASGIGYLLAGMALKQVERMRRRAAFVSAETAAERLPVPR